MGPQEDYIETVFTCEGDYNDPDLQDKLEDFQQSLKDLLLTDKNKLILKKVEPWNSVRVTFNIPREAALRLKQLAQQGNTTLRDLGVLAVQIQDQLISLTIAGRNNERTQLVFKTSNVPASSAAPLSVFDSGSSALDVLEASGASEAGSVEATRKNIADYLRQGAFQDALFGQPSAGSDKFRLPNDTSVTDGLFRPNNAIPSSSGHTAGPHGPFQQLPHTGPGPGHPNINAVSPSRSPVGQAGLKFPSQPGIPPGLPPGLAQHLQLGSGNPLVSLPPPPPYPGHAGTPLMNSLQKTGPSPLLVNLLKNDPAMAGLLGDKLLPPEVLSQQQLQQPKEKKKRKPRKPKEGKEGKVKKQSPGNPDGEVPIQSVPNPALSPYSAASVTTASSAPSVSGLPSATQSLPASHSATPSSSVGNSVNVRGTEVGHKLTHLDHSSVHNTAGFSGDGKVTSTVASLTSSHVIGKKYEQESALFAGENTAGKIVNPYTGLLEPIDNLSDTSPVKSDSGEKVSPKSVFQKRQTTAEVISDMISAGIVEGIHGPGDHPGRHVQRSLPGLPVSHSASVVPSDHVGALGHSLQTHAYGKSQDSSQLGKFPGGENTQQNKFHEHLHPDIIHRKTPPDKPTVLPSVGFTSDSKAQLKTSEPHVELIASDHVTAGKKHVSGVEKVGIPQDSDIQSIPSQNLLNKPLLQVKHNNVGSKPSGSPDSNGDSESSSHSITLDTAVSTDSTSSHTGAPLDASMKLYNSDSGVGSSSERSDDTPSEPGDNDFKSGHANSFDCAKTQIPVVDQLKQNTHNSKVMTVGYAMADLHKDLKNHKELPPYIGSNKHINSKLHPDPSKLHVDKLTPGSGPTNLVTSASWSEKEQQRHLNNYDSGMPQVDGVTRKSPKLVASSPRPLTTNAENQSNSMQGNPEQTMHKIKKSPKNSPRGSPRNSPRASPRTSEMSHGHQRQSLITAQEYAGHVPARVDPSKTPPFCHAAAAMSASVGHKSSHSVGHVPEFDMRPNYHHSSVGLDSIGPQCNIDSAAFLKTLEAYPPNLSQLAALKGAAAFDPKILQQFAPLFQQLQHHAPSQAQLSVPVSHNGSDGRSLSPRSPNGSIPKSSGNVPAHTEIHNSGAETNFQMNSHSNVSVVDQVSPAERDGVLTNCVGLKSSNAGAKSPGGSSISEGQKGSSVSTYSRGRPSSAGAMTNAPNFSMSESHLPPPKRLTESVQKLMGPFLDVNNLPQLKRSPCTSASSSKTSSATTSPQRAASRGSGNRTPNSDQSSAMGTAAVSALDIDSIVPSFTMSFDGPMEVVTVSTRSSVSRNSPATASFPVTLSFTSTYLSCNPHSSLGIPAASTKTVPAVTGSILSPKTYSGESSNALGSAFPLDNLTPPSQLTQPVVGTSHSAGSVTGEVSTCNSDAKMVTASNIEIVKMTAKTNSSNSISQSSGLLPDRTSQVFPQHNARYPLHKLVEKPKSPFSQMGLSEMLQETANLQSISSGRMSPHSLPSSQKGVHQMGQLHPHLPGFDPSKEKRVDFTMVGHLKQGIKSNAMSNQLPANLDSALHNRTTESGESSIMLSSSDPGFPSGTFKGHKLQRQLSDNSSSSAIHVPSAVVSSQATVSTASVAVSTAHIVSAGPPTTDIRLHPLSSTQVVNPVVSASHTSTAFRQSTNSVSDTVQISSVSAEKENSGTTCLVGTIGSEKKASPNENEVSSASPSDHVQTAATSTVGQLTMGSEMAAVHSDLESFTSEQEKVAHSSTVSSVLFQSENMPVTAHVTTAAISPSSLVTGVTCSGANVSVPLSEELVNCVNDDSHMENESHDSDMLNCNAEGQEAHHLRTPRLNRRPKATNEENAEESGGIKFGSSEMDPAPRQLRSRKRNNPSESDNSNSAEDAQVKKMKMEHGENVGKQDSSKEIKTAVGVRSAGQTVPNVNVDGKMGDTLPVKGGEQLLPAVIDSVKSGLRARTHPKNTLAEEKTKVTTRESRKDVKTGMGKAVNDKKIDQGKVAEDPKRSLQNRRNRQSPSALPDKPVNNTGPRDKSPVRSSRTRGRNSPSLVDQQEETQENKRTTRSARSKADVSASDAAAMNKRRRSSRDHR